MHLSATWKKTGGRSKWKWKWEWKGLAIDVLTLDGGAEDGH